MLLTSKNFFSDFAKKKKIAPENDGGNWLILCFWLCFLIPPQMLSQLFWKLSEQTKETLAVEPVFFIAKGGWIGQIEFFKKNATKEIFLIILQNFRNCSFFNIIPKVYEEIFVEPFSWSNDVIIGLSLAKFQLFQNTYRKHFSCSLYLLKSKILDCRAVPSEKKGQFRKDSFWIFEILEHPFLSEHFQNVSVRL